MTRLTTKHYRTCNLCEAMCGLEIEHRGEEILSIKGDKKDPFSRGHICPKALALQDLHQDKDRIRTPLRKTATGWEKISWSVALQEVASNIRKIQKQYGNDAVGLYMGNPLSHNYGALMFLPFLFNSLKTKNRYSAAFIDQLPHQLASKELFGSHALFPIPDLDRTDYFLCIGANPMASKGSIMGAGDITGRLKGIRNRGGSIITVDPRFTETSEIAEAHHFIRPGNDAIFIAAIIRNIFKNNKVNLGHLTHHISNLNILESFCEPFTATLAEQHTGINASEINRIATDFSNANSAIAYCRMGSCTSRNGPITAWLVYCLNIITGNLDQPGGVMFNLPIVDLAGSADFVGEKASFAEYHSRVRGLPEFGGEYSVSTLADEMLTPGEGQIRGFICHGGNPILSIPNGKKLDRALSQLDFMVSIDLYINESSRHANIILPPTSQLEHSHYDLIFSSLAVRNIAKYSQPLFEKKMGEKHDWEILLELVTLLDSRSLLTTAGAKSRKAVLKHLGDEGLLDLAIRFGPYGELGKGLRQVGQLRKRFLLKPQQKSQQPLELPYTQHSDQPDSFTLARLKEYPHGLDLGPLKPCFPERLFTKNKCIDIVPDCYKQHMEELHQQLPRLYEKDEQLLLIGRRNVRSCNSWLHNSQRLVKGKDRCTAMINTNDAERMGIKPGDIVEISSAVGEIQLPATITDKIMKGVVSIPHGWGHNRPGSRLSIAEQHAGGSINDILDDSSVDAFTGMAVINGVPIELKTIHKKKIRLQESGTKVV